MTPVAPRPVTEESGPPLGRSGLNVRELFAAPDQVVPRSRTPAVALDLGLEQARGAMVRNQPADALATLDEVWSGARHTETGWYLRGGSLALLGLPGEAARVVAEGLQANPQSGANHFLQSLAKMTLGDMEAAEQALASAAANANGEGDALLTVQRALLAAHRGDVADAQEMFKRALARWPDHPAMAYGREMMRDLLRMNARDQRKTTSIARTPVFVELLPDETGEAASASANSGTSARNGVHGRHGVDANSQTGFTFDGETEDAISNSGISDLHNATQIAPARAASRDLAHDTLRELGLLLTNGTRRQSLNEARSILVSLSAGGTLAASLPATRAHTARAVLGAIIDALGTSASATGEGWEAESVDGHWQRSAHGSQLAKSALEDVRFPMNDVLRSTVRDLVNELREGRASNASIVLQRARGSIGDSTHSLLRAIAGIEDESGTGASFDATTNEQGTAYIRNSANGHALLAPLRLGLALLPDFELPKQMRRVANDSDESVVYAGSLSASSAFTPARGERGAMGNTGSLVAAVGLLAGSVIAFSVSLPIVAVALAGGGAWLALRKSGRNS